LTQNNSQKALQKKEKRIIAICWNCWELNFQVVKIWEIKFESVEPFFKKVNKYRKTLAASAQIISFLELKNFSKHKNLKGFSLKKIGRIFWNILKLFLFFWMEFLTLINYSTSMPPRYYNIQQKERNLCIYIYINKDENPSTQTYKAWRCKCKHMNKRKLIPSKH
jgi:hypothetical protein